MGLLGQPCLVSCLSALNKTKEEPPIRYGSVALYMAKRWRSLPGQIWPMR